MREAAKTCGSLNVLVDSLYTYLYGGSGPRDPNRVPQAVYNCLIQAGLIPSTVTYEQFYADVSGGHETDSTSTTSQFGPGQGPGFADCWDQAAS
jgi:hypothetical protein